MICPVFMLGLDGAVSGGADADSSNGVVLGRVLIVKHFVLPILPFSRKLR